MSKKAQAMEREGEGENTENVDQDMSEGVDTENVDDTPIIVPVFNHDEIRASVTSALARGKTIEAVADVFGWEPFELEFAYIVASELEAEARDKRLNARIAAANGIAGEMWAAALLSPLLADYVALSQLTGAHIPALDAIPTKAARKASSSVRSEAPNGTGAHAGSLVVIATGEVIGAFTSEASAVKSIDAAYKGGENGATMDRRLKKAGCRFDRQEVAT